MPARQNRVVAFPQKQVGIKPVNEGGTYNTLFGVQDVGVSSSVNLTPLFELGQSAVYDTQEDLPDVEYTLTKLFDGSPLIWHEATRGTTVAPTLLTRATTECVLGMATFPDTNDSVTGTPPVMLESSGLTVSSLAYTIEVDGPFTESVTLVGNDIVYKGDVKIVNTTDLARSNSLDYAGNAAFANNNDSPASGTTLARQNIMFDYLTTLGVDVNGMVADPDATILPPDIDGISASGTNDEANGMYNASIQSITISADLNRENLNELGRRGPYYKRPSLPVDVNCSITINSKSGAMVSMTENGVFGNASGGCALNGNTTDRTIRIATCFGERFYLGAKNRLQSHELGGGGVDGSPETVTYNYVGRNELVVIAQYDPNASGANWWEGRANYLVTT